MRWVLAAVVLAAGSAAASMWSVDVLAHRAVSDIRSFELALFVASPGSVLLVILATACGLLGFYRARDARALVGVGAAVVAMMPLAVLLLIATLWLLAIA